MDNDVRGWVMCTVSGIACIAGACIVCVDIPLRLLPSNRNFRIQESNVFLACSLSLSFGVMIFSALHSMLPSAMRYLAKDGWPEQTAGATLMGCFVGGFFGIQALSRLLHRLMPSHVVDCDHTHVDTSEDHSHPHSQRQSRMSRERHRMSLRHVSSSRLVTENAPGMQEVNGNATESTPLLATEASHSEHALIETREERSRSAVAPQTGRSHLPRSRSRAATRRRSSVLPRVLSFVKDTQENCDELGPCYGYTDPCGQECFKHIGVRSTLSSRGPTFLRTTTSLHTTSGRNGPKCLAEEDFESEAGSASLSPMYRTSRAASRDGHPHLDLSGLCVQQRPSDGRDNRGEQDEDSCSYSADEDLEAQHHHHVPKNAFLSIGLQTVIAIALHKFPEGFITYATNHANPSLGFNVFMALFVHNIAEGFAMALPLYLALGSRWKAILWSSLLGGASQPTGAGLAVLMIHVLNRSHFSVDNAAYACLFASTAGIMTSVALQLFVESLSLNHNRNLAIFFAFLGMVLLGLSNAMVSE